jgi:hypothetical protein
MNCRVIGIAVTSAYLHCTQGISILKEKYKQERYIQDPRPTTKNINKFFCIVM